MANYYIYSPHTDQYFYRGYGSKSISKSQGYKTEGDAKAALTRLKKSLKDSGWAVKEMKFEIVQGNPDKKLTDTGIHKMIVSIGSLSKVELQKALEVTSNKSKDFRVKASDRAMYKKLATLFRAELKGYAKNPQRRKKMTRKKRRTPAQIAATKKLLAFNKKRRGKKITRTSKLGPKLYRRKNPKRKTSAKSRLWIAFVCTGMKVYYAYITDTVKARVGISDKKNKSVLFRTKQRAHDVAKLLAKGWPNSQAGVAPDTATYAQILAACQGKA